MKCFKERREILNRIPSNTPYCYTCVYEKGKQWPVKYDICPYWKRTGKYKAKCTLYNIKDKCPQDHDALLWDQVKVCGLKNKF